MNEEYLLYFFYNVSHFSTLGNTTALGGFTKLSTLMDEPRDRQIFQVKQTDDERATNAFDDEKEKM